MSKMIYESKCLLTDKKCDKTCELWDDCPIEKHDLSDFQFIEAVIKYLKKGTDANSKSEVDR